MISDLKDLVINLLAALIGAALGYAAGHIRRKLKERSLDKAVRRFFGLPGRVLIVHSAVFDAPQDAWNYPATDTKAARRLARLFESVGLREGVNFTIAPDRNIRDGDFWKQNLVLLCGPVRNEIFKRVSPLQSALRYTMFASADGARNVLTDLRREQQLCSSRETGGEVNSGYDWGLVSSFVNPRDPSYRIVLLAGIHGTGTVGAAEYVCDVDNLKTLISRTEAHAISEVLRVDYDGDIETPTNVRLV